MATEIKYNGNTIANLENRKTATLNCENKKMDDNITIIVNEPATEAVPEYEGDVTVSGRVVMINFTVAGTSYEAEEGMTWRQWVDSDYNTAGFFEHFLDGVTCVGIRSGSSSSNGYGVAYNDAFVPITDLIVDGREYTEKYGRHSGGSVN